MDERSKYNHSEKEQQAKFLKEIVFEGIKADDFINSIVFGDFVLVMDISKITFKSGDFNISFAFKADNKKKLDKDYVSSIIKSIADNISKNKGISDDLKNNFFVKDSGKDIEIGFRFKKDTPGADKLIGESVHILRSIEDGLNLNLYREREKAGKEKELKNIFKNISADSLIRSLVYRDFELVRDISETRLSNGILRIYMILRFKSKIQNKIDEIDLYFLRDSSDVPDTKASSDEEENSVDDYTQSAMELIMDEKIINNKEIPSYLKHFFKVYLGENQTLILGFDIFEETLKEKGHGTSRYSLEEIKESAIYALQDIKKFLGLSQGK